MAEELKVIEKRQLLGKEFTIYGTFENPLFLAKEVATWIEHTHTTQMLKSIDEDEKLNVTMLHAGQMRECIFVTENGLYEILFLSRKPIAKAFKKAVKQILSEYRRYGFTATDDMIEEMLRDPKTMIKTLQALEAERMKSRGLEETIEKQKPKMVFASAFEVADTAILVGDLSKILRQNGIDMGSHRLHAWMRDKGYLLKHGSQYNKPSQWAMEMGLFVLNEVTITRPDGSTRICTTTKVSGRGQLYFINLFLKGKEVKHINTEVKALVEEGDLDTTFPKK